MQMPATFGIVGPSSPTSWSQIIQQPTVYIAVEVQGADAQEKGLKLCKNLVDIARRAKTPEKLYGLVKSLQTADIASILLIVPGHHNDVVLVHVGVGTIYLLRKQSIIKLLASTGVLSGDVQSGDAFICVTSSFLPLLSFISVNQIPSSATPEEIAQQFLAKEVQGVGALFVYQMPQNTMPEQSIPSAKPVRSWHVKQRIQKGISHIVFFWSKLQRSPRKLIGTGILLCIALLILIGVIGSLMKKTIPSASSAAVTQAQTALNEGLALLDLNPEKAKDQLSFAKTLIDPLLSQKGQSQDQYATLSRLSKQIDEALILAKRMYSVSPEIFYDVSLVKAGSKVTSLAISDDVLGLVDGTNHSVYTLTLDSKKVDIVGGGDAIGESPKIGTQGPVVYVLSSKGITSFEKGKTTSAVHIAADSAWGILGSFVSYGGNLYILDAGKNRIWKYLSTDKGFSERLEYLNPDALPDLSTATSMAIDGSVWVGKQDGSITRFTQGHENPLSFDTIDPPLGQPVVVYTDDSLTRLYILDPSHKRVVLTDKEGHYVAQYTWTKDLHPTNLVASEKTKRVILLADGVLYTFGLQ